MLQCPHTMKGWGQRQSRDTFLDQLLPPLGPVSQLLGISLLDLGPLVDAVHQVIAEPVPVVNPLHRPLVVPHLPERWTAGWEQQPAVAKPCPLWRQEGTVSASPRPN